jgi:hypothetical protein
VVDEQLGPPVEQLDERLLAFVRVEVVLLLDRDPGKLASLLRELVAEPRVLRSSGSDENPVASKSR